MAARLVHKEFVAKPTLESSAARSPRIGRQKLAFIVRSKGGSYGRTAGVDATAS